MTDVVFRKGKIVFPDGVREGDLVVSGGKIVAFENEYREAVDLEIDCRGKYILPGVIDPHVHMRTPGAVQKEDFGTGSMAALSGGVTTFLDMPNTNPAVIDKKSLILKRSLAEEGSLCNFGLFFGATQDNLEEAIRAKGIVGIKIYLGQSTGGLLVKDDDIVNRLLERAKVPLVFHAEDQECLERYRAMNRDLNRPQAHGEVRPSECAMTAVKRVLHLWKRYEKHARVHIAHVSTREELEVLRKFKDVHAAFSPVTAEVAPHHLFLSDADCDRLGFLSKVNPPLRSNEDREALWTALREGLIDCIATDHAPHLLSEKMPVVSDMDGAVPDYDQIPAGFPGVEFSLPLMLNAVYEARLDFVQLAKVMSENPARIFALSGKGKIEVGYDADLVVVDMELEKEIVREKVLSKCGWSPYEGMKLRGWPTLTMVNGTVMYENPDGISGKFVSGKRGKEVAVRK